MTTPYDVPVWFPIILVGGAIVLAILVFVYFMQGRRAALMYRERSYVASPSAVSAAVVNAAKRVKFEVVRADEREVVLKSSLGPFPGPTITAKILKKTDGSTGMSISGERTSRYGWRAGDLATARFLDEIDLMSQR